MGKLFAISITILNTRLTNRSVIYRMMTKYTKTKAKSGRKMYEHVWLFI
jgi:hypothetical protein